MHKINCTTHAIQQFIDTNSAAAIIGGDRSTMTSWRVIKREFRFVRLSNRCVPYSIKSQPMWLDSIRVEGARDE